MSHGGNFLSPDGSTLKGYLDSEQTVEVLNWLKTQVNNKTINVITYGTSSDDFIEGASVLVIDICLRMNWRWKAWVSWVFLIFPMGRV